MSDFVHKASAKLDKLSPDQIKRILSTQDEKLKLRDSLLNCVDSGLLALDSERNVVYCNDYLSKIFGFDRAKVLSSKPPVDKIIKYEDVLNYISSNNANPGKSSFDFDCESSFAGKMKIRISAYKPKSGSYTMYRFLDITFFEKMKYEFKKNESLAQMTTVAATVAHEIKNPLASISIYLQLLERKLEKEGSVTKEQAEKTLSVINSEIERLNAIAVDFLFAVKPMNVDSSLYDLNDCAKKTYDLAKAELEEQNINFVLDLGSGIPKVNIDSHLVEQCILNLVKNAMQSISGKQAERIVRINTFLDGNSVKLSVVDSGCGISQEQMSKIFEPYYTTKPSGSGLGLTTIFKIMKEHGGEVTVSSKEGEGSVFTLIFPVPESERFRLEQ